MAVRQLSRAARQLLELLRSRRSAFFKDYCCLPSATPLSYSLQGNAATLDFGRADDPLSRSADSARLSTSFVERLDLTVRQCSAYYSLVRQHAGLKFGGEMRTLATEKEGRDLCGLEWPQVRDHVLLLMSPAGLAASASADRGLHEKPVVEARFAPNTRVAIGQTHVVHWAPSRTRCASRASGLAPRSRCELAVCRSTRTPAFSRPS